MFMRAYNPKISLSFGSNSLNRGSRSVVGLVHASYVLAPCSF
jgi:hypothetical protein